MVHIGSKFYSVVTQLQLLVAFLSNQCSELRGDWHDDRCRGLNLYASRNDLLFHKQRVIKFDSGFSASYQSFHHLGPNILDSI